MQKYLRLTSIGALLLVAGVTDYAQATGESFPPPKGWYGNFRLPQIVCDTREQVETIVSAGRDDPDGVLAKAKFTEYKQTINAVGDPTCAVMQVHGYAVGESVSLGQFYPLPGENMTAWATHIGNSNGAFWMLFMVDTDAVLGQSI